MTDVVPTASTWVSGYYLIEAVLTSGPNQGEAAVTRAILRQPANARLSDILVQVPVNTCQAYNHWGGQSLYDPQRGYEVTFERPLGNQARTPMWWEIQLVRFLEPEGYDVSYQTTSTPTRIPGRSCGTASPSMPGATNTGARRCGRRGPRRKRPART